MLHESGIIAVRKRSAQEAVDLGIVLLRRFPRQLYLFIGLPLLLVGLLAFFLIPWPWLSVLLLWWLKPLWDRLVIMPASHLVFHPKATYRELLQHLRTVRIGSLLSDLTWHRFTPYRSYLLPVRLLENLKDRTLSKRLDQMTNRKSGPPVSLTISFLVMEIALYISCLPILISLFPSVADTFALQAVFGVPCYGILLYMICILVVEPYYALAGFGLYLNSRTIIEGWDLALVFRGIGQKGQKLGIALLAMAGLFALQVPANAEAFDTSNNWRETSQTVLSNPDFGTDQEVPVWVLRSGKKPIKTSPEPTETQLQSPNPASGFLSQGLLYVVLIIGGGILLAILASMLFGKSTQRKGGTKTAEQAESRILDSGPDAPDRVPDWSKQAQLLWQQGQTQAALALLYRTALTFIMDLGSLRIPDSATENDCSRLVRKQGKLDTRLSTVFIDIIQSRLRVSYAMRTLAEEEFQALHQRLLDFQNRGGQI